MFAQSNTVHAKIRSPLPPTNFPLPLPLYPLLPPWKGPHCVRWAGGCELEAVVVAAGAVGVEEGVSDCEDADESVAVASLADWQN